MDAVRPSHSEAGTRRSRVILADFVVALCLAATLCHLFVQLPQAARAPRKLTGRDLEIYYSAARAAYARESPYTSARPRALRAAPDRFLYPPPFALMLAPFGGLSLGGFFIAWFALLEVCLWLFCLSLARIAGDGRPWFGALLVGPLAFSGLLVVSFLFGQADILLFCACGLALCAALRDRSALAGAAVAVAACIKLYPALLLLPLIRRFGWRPAAAAAAVMLVAGLGAGAWLGWESYADFGSKALPEIAQGSLHEENTAPVAQIARVAAAGGWLDPNEPAPTWLRRLGTLAGLVVAGAALLVSRRLPLAPAFGWIAGLSILSGAICWTSYWTIFLILAAVIWRARTGSSAGAFSLAMGGVLLLSLAFDPLSFKGPLTAALLLGVAFLWRKMAKERDGG